MPGLVERPDRIRNGIGSFAWHVRVSQTRLRVYGLERKARLMQELGRLWIRS